MSTRYDLADELAGVQRELAAERAKSERLREALEACVSAYESARRDAGCAEDFGELLDREFPLSDAKAALAASTSGGAAS